MSSNAISPATRIMPLGAHPDLRVQGLILGHTGVFVSELVTTAGFALSHILGREWFVERFNPCFHALGEGWAGETVVRGARARRAGPGLC